MTTSLRTTVIGIAILGLTACGGGGGGGAGSSGGTDAPDPASASLSRAADCDDLLASIRADARRKVEVQAEDLRANGWEMVGDATAPTARPTPAPAATASPSAGAPAPNPNDTNTQVPGIDEADVVETDGDRIYLLEPDRLLVLNARPPAASAIVDQVTIEGATLGMFVADGRALVASSVYDTGALGGDSRCGTIGTPLPPITAVPSASSCGSSFVKLTLLDVGTTPARALRELYVEGVYVDARRQGDRARVIVGRNWGTPDALVDPWTAIGALASLHTRDELVARVDAWEQDALAAIDASTLADWVPTTRERVGGSLVEHPLTCTAAAVPPPGRAPSGATLVVGLDLADAGAALDDTLLLGSTSQIYANADTLVLAQPEWQTVTFADRVCIDRCPAGADTRTALHVFGLAADGLAPVYRGSGFVPGFVPSQFGLDVRGDVVRAATIVTTTTTEPFPRAATRVTTTRITDSGLVPLGASGDLAAGETLEGVRFVDDLAYVVTFRQVDPLFVVDLTDPVQPRLLGALTLPGFSEYLQPLDPHHLLTIGRAADDAGRTLGPALRIFDVAQPTAPRLSAEYVLPLGAYTPAEYDHHAFTLDASRGLLALPVTFFVDRQEATLQLFDVDPSAGITARGSVSHGDTGSLPCPFFPEVCGVPETMQRALLIDDAVYSISNLQMQVHGLDDLATPLATVRFP